MKIFRYHLDLELHSVGRSRHIDRPTAAQNGNTERIEVRIVPDYRNRQKLSLVPDVYGARAWGKLHVHVRRLGFMTSRRISPSHPSTYVC